MNTLPSLPLQNGCLFLSASFLDTYSRCPRMGQYYKLNARVAEGGAGQLFGKRIHSALECHYRLQEYGLSKEEVQSRVVQLLESLFAQDGENVDNGFRTLSWAVELYQNYARIYEQEPFKLLTYDTPKDCKWCQGTAVARKVVASIPEGEIAQVEECKMCNSTGKSAIMAEIPFVVHLFDYVDHYTGSAGLDGKRIPIYLHGFIDLAVKKGNLYNIIDYKTDIQLGKSFWNTWDTSAQMKLYCYAFQESTKLPIDGYIIRAIRTGDMLKYMQEGLPNKRGETKSVLRWWEESLPEQHFQLGRDALDAWKQNTIEQVEQFFWHYSRGFFPENRTSCHSKYKCSYFEVCQTYPLSQRLELLNSGLFQDKKVVTPV